MLTWKLSGWIILLLKNDEGVFMHRGLPLLLYLSLVACQPQSSVRLSAPSPLIHKNNLKQPQGNVLKKAPTPLKSIADMKEFGGKITGYSNVDNMSFRLKPFKPSKSFKTQDFAPRFNQIKHLRIWVRGNGIADRLWNGEGFFKVNGTSGTTLTIKNIPKGNNRIVTAQGYDANKKLIPGATLKAYYNSPPNGNSVTVHLVWRFTAAANVIEKILEQNPTMANQLDASQLQEKIDDLIYQGKPLNEQDKPLNEKDYATHPSLINPDDLVESIMTNNGQLPPNQVIVPFASNVEIVVQNLVGDAMGTKINLQIDDPASQTSEISAGVDRKTITDIPPGTWNALIQHDEKPDYTANATVTIAPDGTVTLDKGDTANPIAFPPYLVSATPVIPGGPVPPNLNYHWSGENNGFNVLSNVNSGHGTRYNGTTLTQGLDPNRYTTGVEGRAFALDGNDAILTSATINQSGTSPGWTVMAWVYPTSNNTDEYIISTDNGGIDWSLKRVGTKWGVFNGIASIASNFNVDLNQWQHLSAVFIPGTGVKLYKNMQEQDIPGLGFSTLATPIHIGGRGTTKQFKGRIDEVKSFNRVLTPTEVRDAANIRRVVLTGDGFSPTISNDLVTLGAEKITPTSANANNINIGCASFS